MSVMSVSTRDATLGGPSWNATRRSVRRTFASSTSPPSAAMRERERRSADGGWCSRKLGGRGRPGREPGDGERGRRAHHGGDRRERRSLPWRGDPRHDLTQRAFVGMARAAGLRRTGLDVCARLSAIALQTRIRNHRRTGQRELQHRPDQRQSPPRHVSTHGRNVGEESRWSNAGPACHDADRAKPGLDGIVR